MFREMRIKEQLLSEEDAASVMDRCAYGILTCLGDEDHPYGVPLSYVCVNGIIYFHSAKTGHKIDAIVKHPKVSFTVVDEDAIESAEHAGNIRSVIAFGKARIVEADEQQQAFWAMVGKYSGDKTEEARRRKLAGCREACVIAIDVEYMTGWRTAGSADAEK